MGGTAAPPSPSRCFSGPHLIPGRGPEECVGFLWPPACLQQSWALAAGSPPPRQPRTEAALDGIKTFLAFPGKGFPKPVVAG